MATLANAQWCKKPEKWLNPWLLGTHLWVLRKSYQMNTNMTGLRCFSKIFASLCFGRKWPSLSIGSVKSIFVIQNQINASFTVSLTSAASRIVGHYLGTSNDPKAVPMNQPQESKMSKELASRLGPTPSGSGEYLILMLLFFPKNNRGSKSHALRWF